MRLPDAQQDPLAALVHGRPRVVEGVHGEVGDDEQVGLEARPGEHVLQHLAEVPQLDAGSVEDDQELGQRQLPPVLAEDAEGELHRLAGVALLDEDARQAVVPGLAVAPDPLDRRHDEAGQRLHQLLDVVAEVEVLLRRLADDGGGEDGAAPVVDVPDLEEGVVVAQRVVPEMVAERPLGQAAVCGGTLPVMANSASASRGSGPPGSRTRWSLPPCSREASTSSGIPSGSGAMADRISAGGPPTKTASGRASSRCSATW